MNTTASCHRDGPHEFIVRYHDHKSQGSEFPAVVIPVVTLRYPMLQRNQLYTDITCSKRLVVIVGQRKAVTFGERNLCGRRRWSKLKEWPAATG